MLSISTPLQRRGGTAYGNSFVGGLTTVVSAGANTTGLIVRSCTLYSISTRVCLLLVGGSRTFGVQGTTFNYSGPGLLVPAGQALAVDGTAGAAGEATADLTYDVVP